MGEHRAGEEEREVLEARRSRSGQRSTSREVRSRAAPGRRSRPRRAGGATTLGRGRLFASDGATRGTVQRHSVGLGRHPDEPRRARTSSACLESLAAQGWTAIEVIVVDNASGDPAARRAARPLPRARGAAQRRQPRLRRRLQPGNRGRERRADPAAERRHGARAGRARRARSARSRAIRRWGACQAKLLLMDDPTRLDTAGSFLTATGFLVHRGAFELGGAVHASRTRSSRPRARRCSSGAARSSRSARSTPTSSRTSRRPISAGGSGSPAGASASPPTHACCTSSVRRRPRSRRRSCSSTRSRTVSARC